jgi:hypothetical protein
MDEEKKRGIHEGVIMEDLLKVVEEIFGELFLSPLLLFHC